MFAFVVKPEIIVIEASGQLGRSFNGNALPVYFRDAISRRQRKLSVNFSALAVGGKFKQISHHVKSAVSRAAAFRGAGLYETFVVN